MTQSFYDEDLRFCSSCARYVRYLRSPQQSYCTECGGIVRIYSPEDMAALAQSNRLELTLANRMRSRDGDDPRAVS